MFQFSVLDNMPETTTIFLSIRLFHDALFEVDMEI